MALFRILRTLVIVAAFYFLFLTRRNAPPSQSGAEEESDPHTTPHTPRTPRTPRTPSELTLLVTFIARNNARQLPYLLKNIERLSGIVKKVHVLMVENDSSDATVDDVLKWGIRMGAPTVRDFSHAPEKDFLPPYPKAEDVGPLPPSNHSHIASVWALSFSNGMGAKALPILALARNGYLAMLRSHPWYEDVDFLFPVDTDMCHPWRVTRQQDPPAEGWQGVFTNLLKAEKRWDLIERGIDPHPHPSKHLGKFGEANVSEADDPHQGQFEWSVLFPNGVCGWYIPVIPPNATHRDYPVPPYTPGSFAFYCDRFAYKDAIVGRGNGNQHFWWNCSLPYGGCAPYPGKWDKFACTHVGQGEAIEHHADRQGAEPYTRVISAFGGAALYSAPLLRMRTDCSYSSGGDCEHIEFNECLGRDPPTPPSSSTTSAASKPTKRKRRKGKGKGAKRRKKPTERERPRAGKAEMGIAGRWIVDWEGCGDAPM